MQKQQKFVYMTEKKESCVKDGHWEKQVDFKQTLFHACGQT
jgi:hypothetical protein